MSKSKLGPAIGCVLPQEKYSVASFGLDCMGNVSGWIVYRYRWVKSELSRRADGMILNRDIAGQFANDIYHPRESEQARAAAYAMCDKLNREIA